MNLFTHASDRIAKVTQPHPDLIEIIEPQHCTEGALLPEGNVKLHNYRLIKDNIRVYTPTGDIHTSPAKEKVVPRFEVCSTISPPRTRILELLRPEDPGRDALEAIVKPAPRRGLVRPFDEDTRRFLQRALLSPSPQGLSAAVTPEPGEIQNQKSSTERSLAEELREAEEDALAGRDKTRDTIKECRRCGIDALEREHLGRLALSVEDDESDTGSYGLTNAARKLDELLAESRELHDELAEIQEDIQAESARAGRCAEAARALREESGSLQFLDDILALLRGDVCSATRARAWPFTFGYKNPDRNYII